MQRLTVCSLGLLIAMGACFLPELEEATPAPDPCTSCASTACAAESGACFADPACAVLLECVLACDPDVESCPIDCTTKDGAAEGLPLALPVAECTSVSCADVCPAIPGFGPGTGGGGTAGVGGSGGSSNGGTGGATSGGG